LACADTGDHTGSDLDMVRDSAGVVVTELPADLSGLEAPDLQLEREYRIGMGDASGPALFRVPGARFMADGRLVIAHGGNGNLTLVDPTGRVETKFGRRGEGPGEFYHITSVHVADDGTIIVFDDHLGRLTAFDAAGQLLDTRRRIEPHPLSDVVALIASRSGPLVGVYGDNRTFRPGRDTTPLLRYPAGATRPDTLSMWPTKIWSVGNVGMGGMRVEVAFGPDLLSFGQTDRFALADTHEARVSILDENGDLTMEVRWGETAAPVTEADMERYRTERAARLSDGLPDDVRRGYLEVASHETRPVLEGIALGRDGGVWLAPTALGTDDRQTWLVIDLKGSVRGRVRLPAGSRILDVRDGRLAAWHQDQYDVEVVSVYRVHGGSPTNSPAS
jgi:hypothetical protein